MSVSPAAASGTCVAYSGALAATSDSARESIASRVRVARHLIPAKRVIIHSAARVAAGNAASRSSAGKY
jgi:hypothetical protein